tara:strand:- start:3282 stop:4217 length:936 start_codon:yes stop_codon:yes gene_type:complete
MKNILIYVKSNKKIYPSSSLGGIETLNLGLYKYLKNKENVTLTNKILYKHKKKTWDLIISSNDSKVFNEINSKRNILWLHNKMQIEKSIRKGQFLPMLLNKIEAVFVSKYLEENTSKIYNFSKRIVISNFLLDIFEKEKINLKIKKELNFIWSVKRDYALNDVIDVWCKQIFPRNRNISFHIFGVTRSDKIFKKYNIFFHGNVSKKTLIKFYKKSTAMICLGYDETFCLNAIESMSQGLPIISLGITAVKELLINNYNGFKIDKIDDLPNAVNKIINLNNKKKIKISKNSIKFTKRFHLSTIKKKWNFLIN